MSSKEMVVGGIYIIRYSLNVMKIEVLEITKTSMYLHNLDEDKKFRVDKDDFDCKCFVLETIESESYKIVDPVTKILNKDVIDSLKKEAIDKMTRILNKNIAPQIIVPYDDVSDMFPLDDIDLNNLPEVTLTDEADFIENKDLFKFEKDPNPKIKYMSPEEYRGWNLLEKNLKQKWKKL